MSTELSGLTEQQIIDRCVSGIDKHDRITIETISGNPTTLKLSRLAREIDKIEISAELAKQISAALAPIAEYVKTTTDSSLYQFFSKDRDPKTTTQLIDVAARTIEGADSSGKLTLELKNINGHFTGQMTIQNGAAIETSRGYAVELKQNLLSDFTPEEMVFTVLGPKGSVMEMPFSRNEAIEKLADTCRGIIEADHKLELAHISVGPINGEPENTKAIGHDFNVSRDTGRRLIARLRREFKAEAEHCQLDHGHGISHYTFTPAPL